MGSRHRRAARRRAPGACGVGGRRWEAPGPSRRGPAMPGRDGRRRQALGVPITGRTRGRRPPRAEPRGWSSFSVARGLARGMRASSPRAGRGGAPVIGTTGLLRARKREEMAAPRRAKAAIPRRAQPWSVAVHPRLLPPRDDGEGARRRPTTVEITETHHRYKRRTAPERGPPCNMGRDRRPGGSGRDLKAGRRCVRTAGVCRARRPGQEDRA